MINADSIIDAIYQWYEKIRGSRVLWKDFTLRAKRLQLSSCSMDLIDDFISEQVHKAAQSNMYPFVQTLVSVKENEDNPFLPPDYSEGVDIQSIGSHPAFDLLLKPGCTMMVNFPEEKLPTSSGLSAQYYNNDDLDKMISRDKYEVSEQIRSTYDWDINSGRENSSSSINTKFLGHLKHMTFQIASFSTPFASIEPITCSMFFYNQKDGQFTEEWSIIPQPSAPYFKNIGHPVEPSIAASFLIDPKQLLDTTSYIILLFHHQTMLDNGAAVLKYYQAPSTSNSSGAMKVFQQTFPRIHQSFSTFAWTFVEVPKAKADLIEFPNPYLLESTLNVDNLSLLIQDIGNKKNKQLPFTVIIKEIPNVANIILRPLTVYRIQPIFYPVHQLVVKIENLKFNTKFRNLLIEISLRNGDDGEPIKCLKSKINPLEKVARLYTKCWYHEKSPHFNDVFTIDLPYPITNHVLYFNIFHVPAKLCEKKIVNIGWASLKLTKDKGLLIDSKTHLIQVNNPDKGGNPDKNNKLTITTYFRSNLQSSDENIKSLFKSNSMTIENLQNLTPDVIIPNFVQILNMITQELFDIKKFNFKPYIIIKERCGEALDDAKFEKYLMIFVLYFAFRNEDAIPDQPISLIEQCKPRQKKRSSATVVRTIQSVGSIGEITNSDIVSEIPATDHAFDLIEFDTKPKQTPHTQQSMSLIAHARQKTLINPEISRDSVSSRGSNGSKSEKEFSTSIIKHMKRYLSKNEDITEIIPFLDFAFTLIIKSMIAGDKCKRIHRDFIVFIDLYSEHCLKQPQHAEKMATSLGLFLNMIFDIGMGSVAEKANHAFVTKLLSAPEAHKILVTYAVYAYRPSYFYYSLVFIESFKITINDIIGEAFSEQKTGALIPIFSIIMKNCMFYDFEMCQNVASNLLECVSKIKLYQIPPHINLDPALCFFYFLLNSCDEKSISKVLTLDMTSSLFKLLHFILGKEIKLKRGSVPLRPKVTSREEPVVSQPLQFTSHQKFDTLRLKKPTKPRADGSSIPHPPVLARSSSNFQKKQFDINQVATQSLFRFINSCLSVTNISGAHGLVGFVFHALDLDVQSEDLTLLFKVLSQVITQFASQGIVQISSPCWVKVLYKIFMISFTHPQNSESLALPLRALFNADFQANGNNNRSIVIAYRAISLVHHSQLLLKNFSTFMETMKDDENFALRKFIGIFHNLTEISELLGNPKLSPEQRTDYLFQRFVILAGSPDAQFEVLEELKNSQSQYGNNTEYVIIILLQAALVLEYLTALKRMPNYFESPHPAMQFACVCPLAESIIVPDSLLRDLPNVPTFCDSPFFSELGFISLLENAFQYAREKKIFEIGLVFLDLCWPILEQMRLFEQVSTLFSDYEEFYKELAAQIPLDSECLDNRFYRVKYSGQIFGAEDGKTYIYRADPLTHLYDFSKKIVKQYAALYGDALVKLKTDSDEEMDPEIGYIKVSFVEPYSFIEPPIGQARLIKKFYFDTPFVKGEKKMQGTIETQWIRRTILNTSHPLPSIVKRAYVDPEEISKIEYEPIKVAFRQIKERTNTLCHANSMKDLRHIQQLLHGSLLTQVNEGPAKIADVCFNGNGKQRDKQKLHNAFKDFIKAMSEGVKIHAEWVVQNTEFIPLQVQLEAGLESLIEKLKQYKE